MCFMAGEVADGIDEDTSPAPDGSRRPTRAVREFIARQAMRTSAFWLIAAGLAFALLAVSTMMVHLISHFAQSDLGFTLTAAGGVVAMMTMAQIVGQLSGDFFGDRLNKRFMSSGCLLGHGVGMWVVAFATTPLMVFIGVLTHGLAWGVRGALMTALRAGYFGSRSFGAIVGFSSLIVMLGISLGPVVAGYMADVTGNYELGFALFGGCCLLGSACFMAARPPAIPQ